MTSDPERQIVGIPVAGVKDGFAQGVRGRVFHQQGCALLGFDDLVASGQNPGGDPPKRPTAWMALQKTATRWENGCGLIRGKGRQAPGRLGSDVRRSAPTRAGDRSEHLDRVHDTKIGRFEGDASTGLSKGSGTPDVDRRNFSMPIAL
jgi:hypothetical protein